MNTEGGVMPCAEQHQHGLLARHAPDTVESLAMHKKKIEEIRGWLELQQQPGLHCEAPRMLVLSGIYMFRQRRAANTRVCEVSALPCARKVRKSIM